MLEKQTIILKHKNFLLPGCGIIKDDYQPILKTASQKNVIIMFRSTGVFAKPWLELGYPSKNFHIKGKTSNFGIIAGLVPYDGNFSKLWWDKTKAAKCTSENDKSIQEGFAIKEKFVISDFEFQKAKDNYNENTNVFYNLSKVYNSKNYEIYSFRMKHPITHENKKFFIYLQPFRKLSYSLFDKPLKYYIVSISNNVNYLNLDSYQNIEVMSYICSKNNKKYIAGDYDLFNICPTYGNLDEKDMPVENRLNTIGISSLSIPPMFRYNNMKKNNAIQHERYKSIIEYNMPFREDPHKGNITKRIDEIIKELSINLTSIRSNISKELLLNTRVHHNSEAYNPFADELENCFPVSYFLPEQFWKPNVKNTGIIQNYVMKNSHVFGSLNSKNDLIEFADFIYEYGYYFPKNKKWGLKSPHLEKRKHSLEEFLQNKRQN